MNATPDYGFTEAAIRVLDSLIVELRGSPQVLNLPDWILECSSHFAKEAKSDQIKALLYHGALAEAIKRLTLDDTISRTSTPPAIADQETQ